MGPSTLLALLLQGALLGGLYALAGYGFSISLGIVREINVAHGDLMMLAAYMSLALLDAWGIQPLLGLAITVPAMFAVGWLLQRGLLNRALRRGPSHVVVVTFALGIAIENLLLMIFSYNDRTLASGFLLGGVALGPIRVQAVMLLDMAASLAVLAILELVMRFTMVGKAMRAVPANEYAARVLGITPERLYPIAMGMAMAVNAVAGALIGSTFIFYPSAGPDYLMIAFGAVILGGLGSLAGTLLGGLLMGEIFVFSGYLFGATYQMMVTLLAILVVMVVSPRGVLRGEVF